MSVRQVSLEADKTELDQAVVEALEDIERVNRRQDEVESNNEQIEQRIEELEAKSRDVSRSILTGLRKTAAIVAFVAQQSNNAIAQALSLTFEATVLTAETLQTIAAAESLTGVGILTAGLKLTAATFLFSQASQIAIARERATEENAYVQGLLLAAATF